MRFIEWAVTARYQAHMDGNKAHCLVYDDESYITLETGNFGQPLYTVHLGNIESTFDSKCDAERLLWDSHSRFNYEESWRIHGFCQIKYLSKSGETLSTVRDFDHVVSGDDWTEVKSFGVHNTILSFPQSAYPDDMEDLIDLEYISLSTERV